MALVRSTGNDRGVMNRYEVSIIVDEDPMKDEFAQLGGSGFVLAMHLLGNRDDAADAVQDSLYNAWRRRRSFDHRRGELRAWFLKIVRNRCLDVMRRRKTRTTDELPVADLAATRELRPEANAEQRELVDLVQRQLLQMPPDQREIILLRDFHDLSYAEIAQVLGVASGTVMSRLHRARNELRRRMEPYR